MYSIKEIFYSLQGEGAQSGRPTVFCRFAGCNLWNGLEQDRKSAICNFCDTDFVGTDGTFGGKYSFEKLAERINMMFPLNAKHKYTVLTGGEPLLQVDENLINAIHNYGIEIGVETNGTIKVPNGIDWICVSPKFGTELKQTSGNEIKIVFPQLGLNPKDYENFDFEHFYLQPKANADTFDTTNFAITFCIWNPKWKLSLQTHKLLNLR
jgi:7-carboxy-7-deazaguanine synthase (Cx14CxxC type)